VSRIPILFLAVFAAALMALLPACGKKGPPFLPEKKLLLRVDQVEGKWRDGRAFLEGYVGGGEEQISGVTGCRVYHAWYPADNPPCEGCPIEMSGFKEINEKIISGDRFSCDVPGVEKKGIWFFEVRLIGRSGAVGPPSDRIKLKIEN